MTGRRALGWLANAAAAALALVPLVALAVASVVDRGPAGQVRTSGWYLALGLLDPFVWRCVQHSCTVAVIVTLLSRWLGVSLARATVRWRFWGRGPLGALALWPLAVPPVVAALGVRFWLDRLGPWPGRGMDIRSWLGWIWVGVAAGVPIVLVTTRAALRLIDPSWEDAAKLAGASGWQVWRSVTWPLVRPAVSRALAAVFTLTLLEPGAPLVLNLRRTLAFQVVDACWSGGSGVPRTSALVLIGLAIVAVARLLLNWWGKAGWEVEAGPSRVVPRRAGPGRGLALALLLAGWLALGLLPVAALVVQSLGGPDALTHAGAVARAQALVEAFREDRQAPGIAGRSLALGLVAGGAGLILAWALAARPVHRPSRASRWLRTLVGLPEAMPPLAIGVGLWAWPALLRDAADGLFASSSGIGEILRGVASVLDPFGAPDVLLAVALVTVHLPGLIRAAELANQNTPRVWAEAATTVGASRRRARRLLARLWLGSAPSAALWLTVAIAATSLAPAIVLAPTAESQPIGPILLDLAHTPGGGMTRAAQWAVAAVGLNLLALFWATRSRRGQTGLWFRG